MDKGPWFPCSMLSTIATSYWMLIQVLVSVPCFLIAHIFAPYIDTNDTNITDISRKPFSFPTWAVDPWSIQSTKAYENFEICKKKQQKKKNTK